MKRLYEAREVSRKGMEKAEGLKKRDEAEEMPGKLAYVYFRDV